MYYFFRTIYFFIFISVFLSCGKEDGVDTKYIKAKEELNNKNYAAANMLFKDLVDRYPDKRDYKQYLTDSYLGMGGFELFDFLVSIEKILTNSFESEEIINELRPLLINISRLGPKKRRIL